MTPLEIKKLKLELLEVSTAKARLQFRIEEKMDEIARVEDHIKVQEKREQELTDMIAKATETVNG